MKKNSLFLIAMAMLIFNISCSTKKSEITEIKVEKLAETSQSWNGEALPNYLVGTPKVTILKITIPPKTKLKIHKHLVINAGVLLKGELKVVDEHKNVLNLKEGDPIVECVNTWHHGENNTDKPAEIIVFYAGNVDVPITVLKEGEGEGEGHY